MGIDAAPVHGAGMLLEEKSADVSHACEIAVDEEGMGIDAAPLQGFEMPPDVLLGCEKISVGTSVTDNAEINDVVSARGGAGDETAALPTYEIPIVESQEEDCFTVASQKNERVSDKRSSDGEDGIKLEDMCSGGSPFDFQGNFQSLRIYHPSSEENGLVPSTEAPVATGKASVEQESLVSLDELVQPNVELLHREEDSGSLKEGLCEIAAASMLDCEELVQPNVNLPSVEENTGSVKEGLCGTGTAAMCMLDESFGRPDSCGADYFSKSSSDLDIPRLNPAEITTLTEAVNEVGVGSGDELVQPNVNLLPVQENSGSSKEGLCEIADECMLDCDELAQTNGNLLPVEENSSSLEEGLCEIADLCTLDESFGRPDSCLGNYFLKSCSDLDISSVNHAEITTVTEAVNEAVGNGDELVQPNVNLQPVEENSGSSKEGLCEIADVCMPNVSIGRPDSRVGGYFSKSSCDLDISRVNLAEGYTLTEAVNEVGLGNSERRDLARSVSVSPMACPEVMASSSSCRRGYLDGKSGRKTRSKKGAKDSEARDLIFKGSKGKRTCSSKTPRSSAWGVFQDLSQHFEQMSQVSPKVNGQGCGNESLKDTGGISQGSNGKTNGKRIRLKVKVGNQVVLISEVVDNVATANTRGTVSTMDAKDSDSVACLDKKLDKEKTDYLPVNLDTGLIPKESTGGAEASSEPPSHVDIDRFLGSETSPDSEVINVMPEPHLTERHAEGVENIALGSAYEEIDISRKGKKKDKQTAKRRDVRKKLGEDVASLTSIGLGYSGNVESSSLPRHEELASSNAFMPVENVKGEEVFPGSVDPDNPNHNVLSQSKKKGQTRKNKQGSASRKNEKAGKIISTRKVKEMVVHDQVLCESETFKQTGTSTKELERSKGHHAIVSAGCPQFEMITDQLKEELSPERNAWVRCDECHKWRRIAATLADNIEATNSSWTCKENMDTSFADCSILQEKSNAEINAELDISDEDEDYDAHRNYKDLGSTRPPVSQQSSFIQIDSNKYLHRRRRTQTIDEVMVCHCMPPSSGKLGCGEECLNRMLNIECVQGTCPCGDLCSNQQFQKRNYAKLQWFKCGRKGYGLQLQEGVRKGGFIIEYVGEVLDVPSYEARQRDYASKGHKHFYFMTLNGSEVIDACVKGNMGRFINHSCEPNCRTEKWMVNGEICIGLFAVRDIKKGEELTFDYNYVRVFGAAAKKCVCGSSQCRGYIGGDLQSSEVIVQGDSDDEFPEPIMLNEDGTYNMDYISSATVGGHENPGLEVLPEDGNEIGGLLKLDSFSGVEDADNRFGPAVSQLKVPPGSEETLPFPLPLQSKDITGSPSPAIQRTDSVYQEFKGISNAAEVSAVNEPFRTPPPDDASVKPNDKGSVIQVRPQMKTSKSSTSVKKGKSGSSMLKLNQNKVKGMASKPQAVPAKPRKTIEGTSNGRYEAVQGKLSELLDGDGGISKRKDAAKGYLKLLLLTAAGDTVNGEAIQSNRDLSMILDALLKTRSKVVLLDIVNKNGLRMLHNIMKQYRRDFKKIPILRKLLKVLEYLALREVLTLEHIIVGPPCPGMESFRESILSFTEHDDKQVHQIARNFRDRWIPRHIRKHGYNIDRDDNKDTMRGLNYTSNFSASQNPNWYDSQSRHTEASSMNDGSTTSSAENTTAEGTRIRKRKSRWDQDAVPFKSSKNLVDEDAPPGFSTLPDNSKGSSNSSSTNMNQIEDKVQYLRCPFDAVIGQPQERFKPRSPVSYGVPLLILQQFGTPHAGSIDSWAIAPGMPFHPFPPLPPHPRPTKQPSPTDSADCGTNKDRSDHQNSMENQILPQKRALSPNWNSSYCSSDDNQKTPQDSKNPTSPARSVGWGNERSSGSPDETVVENHDDGNSNAAASTDLQEDTMESEDQAQTQSVFKRLKVSSSSSSSSSSQDLGKKYFRQQKGNNVKPPPWVWKRKCWGYSGLNSRVGGSVGSTTGVNENRNSSSSTDSLVSKGEKDGSDYQ